MSNWSERLKYNPANATRPVLTRTPSELRDKLQRTLKSGVLQIPQADLPIRLKSLRTQVVSIARKLKARSHVLLDRKTDMVHLWLEPTAPARKNGGKRKKPAPKAADAPADNA